MARQEYFAEAIRPLGKYLEKIQELLPEEAESLIGKCYFASCNLVDRTQVDINQDRELVRIFAKTLKDLLEKNTDCIDIEREAAGFARKCESTMIPQVYPSSRISLYEVSRENCPELGYYGTGRKILNASESLRGKLPQDNKQFVQDHAVMILSSYLRNSTH